MSLPPCQQRVLDGMEGALRASEPRLTSMYAIFARLNAGEPVGAERIARQRSRWLRQGSAMCAIVLIPVMFAAIIVGALLGGGARSATTCDAGYSVGGVSPLASRPSCPVAGAVTGARAAARETLASSLACATTGQAARFVTLTGGNRVFVPAARAIAAAAGPPGGC